MSESFPYHKIESVCSTCVRPCTQGVLRHDFRNSHISCFDTHANDSKGKILCREDTRNTIVVVCDKNAVFSLRSHQLGRFGNGGIRLDLKSLARLEGKHSPGRSLPCMPAF